MNRLSNRRRRHGDRFGRNLWLDRRGLRQGGLQIGLQAGLLGDRLGDLLVTDRVRRAHLHRDHVEERLVMRFGVLGFGVLRFGDTIGEPRPPGELPRLLRARLRPPQARPRRVQPSSRRVLRRPAVQRPLRSSPRGSSSNPAKKAQPPRSLPRAYGPRRRTPTAVPRVRQMPRRRAALASSEDICSAPVSMTATCESIRSQIRPSLPISRRRQAISRSTRAPLRTGARRCSSARLSSASARRLLGRLDRAAHGGERVVQIVSRGGCSGGGFRGLLLVRRKFFLKRLS